MNYEEIICDANNLYRAYKVSVKTSKWKETTQKFMMNFLRYIFSIQDDLMNRTLQNGPTQEFTLFERGRVRPITSIQIRDRIIRHVLCDEVLLPEVKKHIIYDNCASIKGRGISHQRDRFEVHLRKYYPTSSGDGSRRTNMKICTIISTSPMKRWAEMAQLRKSCRRSISCPFTNQPIFKKISRRN